MRVPENIIQLIGIKWAVNNLMFVSLPSSPFSRQTSYVICGSIRIECNFIFFFQLFYKLPYRNGFQNKGTKSFMWIALRRSISIEKS